MWHHGQYINWGSWLGEAIAAQEWAGHQFSGWWAIALCIPCFYCYCCYLFLCCSVKLFLFQLTSFTFFFFPPTLLSILLRQRGEVSGPMVLSCQLGPNHNTNTQIRPRSSSINLKWKAWCPTHVVEPFMWQCIYEIFLFLTHRIEWYISWLVRVWLEELVQTWS